jgi:GNAT superfamily N-acetyltransferase
MEIIDYQASYQSAFKRLNVEWIEMHWQLEAADHQSLDHPEEYIIAGGGHIFLALDSGEVVGTCALIRITDIRYELAKMAVDAKARGKGIGAALGNAVISKARSERAEELYLESNTILKPAIHLYRKLGFKEFVGEPSPYVRCNIQMVLELINIETA